MTVTNNPYCELTDIKMGLNLQSGTNDVWITSLIPQAQAAIDRELGYSFQQDGTTQAPTTRYYSGTDDEILFIGPTLSFSQVLQTSISLSIASNGFWIVPTASPQDITADCYVGPDNYNPGWLLQRLSGFQFYQGNRNYTVTGVFGYSSIPIDITRACTRLVIHWVKMRDTNYADVLAEQGAVRQKYVKKMPDDVQEILDDYYLRRFYSR